MGQLPNFVQLLRSDEKREIVLLLNKNGEILSGFPSTPVKPLQRRPNNFR